MNVSRIAVAIAAAALVGASAAGQTTTRVSVDPTSADGNGASIRPSLSGDGRFVAFESAADNLIAGDTNGVVDVFLRDLGAGTDIRVSVASDGSEANGDSHIYRQAVSGDGRFVVFESIATNLVPGDTKGSGTSSSATRRTARPIVSASTPSAPRPIGIARSRRSPPTVGTSRSPARRTTSSRTTRTVPTTLSSSIARPRQRLA
jgi:Tol biopolymer transport system component